MDNNETKKSRMLPKIIVMVVIIAALLMIIFSIGDVNAIFDELSRVNPGFFVLAVLSAIVGVLLMAASNQIVLRTITKEVPKKDSYLMFLTEPFFNGITPFSSGAQPFFIYQLIKNKVSGEKASSTVVGNFLLFQATIVIFIFSSFFIFFNQINSAVSNNLWYIIVGLVINVFALVLLILLSTSKKFYSLIRVILKFFEKFKFSHKIATKLSARAESFVANFQAGIKALLPRKRIFIASTLLNLVSYCFKYGSIIFILLAMGHSLSANDALYLVAASSLAVITMMWVPLPGGSGGTEWAFQLLLAPLFLTGDINIILALIIVWRFATYYLQIAFGFVAYIIYSAVNRKTLKNNQI